MLALEALSVRILTFPMKKCIVLHDVLGTQHRTSLLSSLLRDLQRMLHQAEENVEEPIATRIFEVPKAKSMSFFFALLATIKYRVWRYHKKQRMMVNDTQKER